MKKLHLLLSAALIALCAMNASAAETAQKAEPKNNIKLYGFIRNYLIFDSRESVSGTGDLFYYLPKDVKMNEAGTQDLNAASSFRFLALTSRLGVDVTGYSIENVHFGAKIEADFYSGLGSASDVKGYFPSNTKISGTAAMRLRQAYATVTWKELGDEGKNSLALKMGQAWHPMGADFPHVFSLEIGAPFGPFSRTPLVQADYNLGKNWTLTGAAITQMQYNSQGPIGASPLYMKYGMTPEIYAGLTYKSNGFLVRGGVDVLSIKPRYYGLATVNGVESTVRVADRKTSVLGFVFTQYTKDKFSVRWSFI